MPTDSITWVLTIGRDTVAWTSGNETHIALWAVVIAFILLLSLAEAIRRKVG